MEKMIITPAPRIGLGSHPKRELIAVEAQNIIEDCGDFFDASESISDCLARQRLGL